MITGRMASAKTNTSPSSSETSDALDGEFEANARAVFHPLLAGRGGDQRVKAPTPFNLTETPLARGTQPHRGQRGHGQDLRHHRPVCAAHRGREPLGAGDPRGDLHRRGHRGTASPRAPGAGPGIAGFCLRGERHPLPEGAGGKIPGPIPGDGGPAAKCPVRLRRGADLHDPRLLPADASGPGVRERAALRHRAGHRSLGVHAGDRR